MEHEHSQAEHDDAGWAFRVLQAYGSVARFPTDVGAFRRALHRLADQHDARIKTYMLANGLVGAALDPLPSRIIEAIPLEEHALMDVVEERNRYGGWLWDERLRRPPLRLAG